MLGRINLDFVCHCCCDITLFCSWIC